MARDAITPVALVADGNADVANGTVGVTINTTNGATLITDGRTRRYLLHIKNTNGTGRVATVKAPTTNNPPAFRQGLGDLAVTVAATSGEQMIVVNSSRFVQADKGIYIDFAASFAGTIAAYKMPEAV